MMHNDLAELETIVRAILDSQRKLADLIPQAEALRDWYEKQRHFSLDPLQDIGNGQTRLAAGLAISPVLAALCIRELYRTPVFIRGLAQAIGEAGQPDRPVRVLYAGCGPYAALAIPLLAVLPKGRAVFTLMDVHDDCLDSARALIEACGFEDGVDEYLCADATRYRIPADKIPDVIVSETMAVCLRNEPQVSIARNLLSQASAARMVPQAVSVEFCMLNPAREHVLMPADYVGEIPAPQRDRINLGRIFELDAANIRSWEKLEGNRLPAGPVRIPEFLDGRYQPYLLTGIDVYGDHRLQDYDCSLTCPQPLRGKPKFVGGETLQFHYEVVEYPELKYEVVA